MIVPAPEDQSPAGPEAAPDHAINIEGMRKAYGRTIALRDLSMHVPRGSIYGFVGPNGAGKTTTIRTLATLQRADNGLAQVAGIDVHKNPAAVRDRIGFMPDFFGVYDSLTVWEYLNFYGSTHHLPAHRRKQTCEELLELVDLGEKRGEPVAALSRGMKQRLGLARCLIHDPEVLLLDEPASGMDPRARIELREILRELRALGKTILISSHILPELAEMCTHIGIIRAGELLAEGPVDAVISELSGGSRLRVRVMDGRALEAAAILEAAPSCQDVQQGGDGSLLASFEGGDAELQRLLTQLISAGVPVIGFTLEGGTLEDIFLSMTALGEDEA